MITAREFIDYLDRKEIPPSPPMMCSRFSPENYKARREVTERGMWALVYHSWIEQLAEWIGDRKVLEVMAGRGWLAKALAENGVDVIATDNGSWDEDHAKIDDVFPIVKKDAVEAIKEIEADILIMSWPPYGDDVATKALVAWGEGKPVIYIGEGYGGCNAPDSFFQRWMLSKEVEIPIAKWDGLHDSIEVGYYTHNAHNVCEGCGGWSYDGELCWRCED